MGSNGKLELVTTDLEIDERLEAHKTGFTVQKAGLVMILGLVLLAAVGTFGDGLLSKATASGSSARIEYEQFYRFESRMKIRIQLQNESGSPAVISFPNEYLKNFKIEAIVPEPSENRIESDYIKYSFAGTGYKEIVFHVVPQKVGVIKGSAQINQDSFPIHHFIYP